jgi:hypothetical protein
MRGVRAHERGERGRGTYPSVVHISKSVRIVTAILLKFIRSLTHWRLTQSTAS